MVLLHRTEEYQLYWMKIFSKGKRYLGSEASGEKIVSKCFWCAFAANKKQSKQCSKYYSCQ